MLTWTTKKKKKEQRFIKCLARGLGHSLTRSLAHIHSFTIEHTKLGHELNSVKQIGKIIIVIRKKKKENILIPSNKERNAPIHPPFRFSFWRS